MIFYSRWPTFVVLMGTFTHFDPCPNCEVLKRTARSAVRQGILLARQKAHQLLISVSSEGNPRNKSSPMIPMHTLYTAYPLTKLSHGLIVLLLAFGAGGCSFWTNVVILPGYNQ